MNQKHEKNIYPPPPLPSPSPGSSCVTRHSSLVTRGGGWRGGGTMNITDTQGKTLTDGITHSFKILEVLCMVWTLLQLC